MKQLLRLLALVCLYATSTYAQDKTEHLLGKISRNELLQEPFGAWFKENYDGYKVRKSYFKDTELSLKNLKVKVFLGTWCGDSKREVPPFLKIMDSQKVPSPNIEILALGQASQGLYKQSPTHEEQNMGIHRVPTFIFYENDQEIGRIVESPVVSLEQDIARILNREKQKSNYAMATAFLKAFETGSVDIKQARINEWADEYRNRVSSSGEFNTLGYVLLARKRNDEALFVLQLNALLFPNVANMYDSLGEAYAISGNKQKAAESYQKVLQLDPANSNAQKALKELQ